MFDGQRKSQFNSSSTIYIQPIKEIGIIRVGGKRNCFSPTFIFRPLTIPYYPFIDLDGNSNTGGCPSLIPMREAWKILPPDIFRPIDDEQYEKIGIIMSQGSC